MSSPTPERDRVEWYLAGFAAIVLLLLLTCGCASSGFQPGERAALAADLGDLATTAYGLHSGLAREANPLYGSDDTGLLIAVAVKAAIHWAIRTYLNDSTPAEQARSWKYVTALRLTVGAWNLSQIGKGGER